MNADDLLALAESLSLNPTTATLEACLSRARSLVAIAEAGPHRCGRSGTRHTIFEIDDCDTCLRLFAAESPGNGWTQDSLAKAVAELRRHGTVRGAACDPEPADVARVSHAFRGLTTRDRPT